MRVYYTDQKNLSDQKKSFVHKKVVQRVVKKRDEDIHRLDKELFMMSAAYLAAKKDMDNLQSLVARLFMVILTLVFVAFIGWMV